MKIILLGLVFLGFLGCGFFGDDDEDEKTESSCTFGEVGCAKVIEASAGTITVDLTSNSGTYVVSPYAIGNTSAVSGGVSGQNISFGSGVSLTSVQNRFESKSVKELISIKNNIEHAFLTRLTNRTFQTYEFQKMIDDYDQVSFILSGERKSIRGELENRLYKFKSLKLSSDFNFLASSCSLNEITLVYGAIALDTSKTVAGSDHCVYVEDGFDFPHTSISAIPGKIFDAMKVLFSDSFDIANGFTFEPIFVFADSQAEGGAYATSVGFFDSVATEALNRPVLVIPAEVSDTSRTLQNQIGTLAHEFTHAIEYYFKVKRNGIDQEPLGIGEGVAHFFQDVFGDGTYNFEGYVDGFMSSWTLSPTIALNASGDTLSSRGGAASFFNYLAGRNGSFTTDSGYVSGTGVSYIANYIKYDGTSTAGLDAYLDGNLVKVFGEFGAALVLSGTSAESTDAKFKFKASFSSTDLAGGGSTFGFYANDSRGAGDKLADFSSYYLDADASGVEVPYYTFSPKAVSGGSTVTYDTSETNSAAFVVRVK